MARMYSRKRGKSGSHKPMKKIAPWIEYKPKEIEELVRGFPSHPLVGNPSVNLGVISGGDATNRIPVRCDSRLDVRVMPGMAVSSAPAVVSCSLAIKSLLSYDYKNTGTLSIL